MVLDRTSSHAYYQGSVLGPTLFLQCISDVRDDVICNTAIKLMDDATSTLSVIRHRISNSNYSHLLNLSLIYKTL